MPFFAQFQINQAVEQFVLQHSVSRLKTAAEGSETTYVWGDGAGTYAEVMGGGFDTQKSSNTDETPTKQDELACDADQVINLRELSRDYVTRRIYQNNDTASENWVDVRYAVKLLCQSDRDQKMYRFHLNPPGG